MQKWEYVSFNVEIRMFGMSVGKEGFENFANKMGNQGWRLHLFISTSDRTAIAIFERPVGTKEEDV